MELLLCAVDANGKSSFIPQQTKVATQSIYLEGTWLQ